MRQFLLIFFLWVAASDALANVWQSCNGVGPVGSAASVCQDLVKKAGESYEFSHTESQDETTVTCYAKYKDSSGSPDLVGSACKIDGNAAIDSNTDQDMINNLVKERQNKNKSANGDATFAQGRDGDGNLTPVRESIPGETPAEAVHAEPQVLNDLKDKPKPHTVAVDQNPCHECAPILVKSGVDKVIVPSKASNPDGSPKTAAIAAAGKGTKVTPREIKLDEKSKNGEKNE